MKSKRKGNRDAGRSDKSAAEAAAIAIATVDDPIKALDAIFEPWNRSDAPGMVVGVARDGQVIYRRGIGMASIEHGVANTPKTRMRIGSTAKHFASLAALLLVEAGKLDIDAPATRYLPELPKLSGVPTLRHFMNHTSGYRDYVDLIALAASNAIQPPGTGLRMQALQSGVNFAPGCGQIYCNGGYHLLSIAIERAAGMPFEQFLKTRIFDPLGMVDTVSQPGDMELSHGMATLHVARPSGAWRRGLFITEEIRGEGAIVSTVDDMLKWLAHLREPTVVGTASSWREMATLARFENGMVSNYGMGLFRHAYRDIDLVYHGGAVIGGMCQMLTAPAHRLDVIVITNGALVSPAELTWKVLDVLLAEHMRSEAPVRASSARFKHLFGTRYASDSGLVFGFADVKGKLGISFQASPPAPLLRDEHDFLRVGFEDLAMGPFLWRVDDLRATPGGGAPKVLPMTESGYPVVLHRLPKKAPAARTAAPALIGSYRCPDLDADAKVYLDGEVLVLRILGECGLMRMSIAPLSPTLLALTVLDPTAPATYAATIETNGRRVVGFQVDSMRTRRLRFERIAD